MNFCFWPSEGEEESPLQYHHIAGALKQLALTDFYVEGKKTYRFSSQNLAAIDDSFFENELNPLLPVKIPAATERCRLLRELGEGLLLFYEGSATKMLEAANSSADALTGIISSAFPGFRDSVVDRFGRQCFFYKRAQIAVADLWAALKKSGHTSHPCDFSDIDCITTFADYRVPQLLRDMNVLVYSTTLSKIIDEKREIFSGSQEEIEIRAATIVAVERIVQEVNSRKEEGSKDVNAIFIDWLLWQRGEKLEAAGKLSPHHRVRTIFY